MLCALHAVVWHSSKPCCLEQVGSDLTCHELHFFCCLLQSLPSQKHNGLAYRKQTLTISPLFLSLYQSGMSRHSIALGCFISNSGLRCFLGVHERPWNEGWLGVTALFLMIPKMPQIYLCSVYKHSRLLSVDHYKTKTQNNSEKYQRSPTASNSQLIFSYLRKTAKTALSFVFADGNIVFTKEMLYNKFLTGSFKIFMDCHCRWDITMWWTERCWWSWLSPPVSGL